MRSRNSSNTAEGLAGEGIAVLVADDDAVTRRLLAHHLESAGYRVSLACDGQEAIDRATSDPAVILLDLQMPRIDGMACLRHFRQTLPDTPVVMISQFGQIRDAVEAMKQGAAEYITKPVDPDELLTRVAQVVRSLRLARENRQLRQAVSALMPSAVFTGTAPAVRKLLEQAQRVAQLDATVLITGESGTGKTTLARRIHQGGSRSAGPFIAVSCAALPRDLIEAELFGHVRGAYTGAVADRPGKVEMADGGTLLLDEIGDLPLELQPKLLAVLQDKTVQRIGDTKARQIDVRIIAATHQDLEAKCRARSFREDLYFRINVLPLSAPPLRERREDIVGFAEFILRRIAEKRHAVPLELSEPAKELLLSYNWPGNIRELENVLERASAFCESATIGVVDLALAPPAQPTPAPLSMTGMTLAEIEARAIAEALDACHGNKKAAARQLGIDEKTIHNKLKRLGATGKTR